MIRFVKVRQINDYVSTCNLGSLDIVLQYKVSEVQDMDQVVKKFEDTIKTRVF